MKNLSQALNETLNKEIEYLIQYAKSKSSTYGEVRKLIRELDWNSRDRMTSFVAQEANKRLQEEIDELPILKGERNDA